MDYISLVEWAQMNGIDPSTARHKAIKGNFKTARKIGRNWVIDRNEKHIDLRYKCNKGGHKDEKQQR